MWDGGVPSGGFPRCAMSSESVSFKKRSQAQKMRFCERRTCTPRIRSRNARRNGKSSSKWRLGAPSSLSGNISKGAPRTGLTQVPGSCRNDPQGSFSAQTPLPAPRPRGSKALATSSAGPCPSPLALRATPTHCLPGCVPLPAGTPLNTTSTKQPSLHPAGPSTPADLTSCAVSGLGTSFLSHSMAGSWQTFAD